MDICFPVEIWKMIWDWSDAEGRINITKAIGFSRHEGVFSDYPKISIPSLDLALRPAHFSTNGRGQISRVWRFISIPNHKLIEIEMSLGGRGYAPWLSVWKYEIIDDNITQPTAIWTTVL